MMESILAKAAKKCDQAELYYEQNNSLLTRSSLDKIEACKSSLDSGYGLRVINKGRIGYSYFKQASDADRAIAEAIRSAKLSHRENYSLPGKSRYSKLKIFDKKIESLDIEKLVDLLTESMDATSEYANPMKAEVETEISTTRIINTEGVDAKSKESHFTIFCVGQKSESQGDDYFTSKRFSNKANAIGTSAGELSVKGEGAKPIDYEGPITLHPDVVSSFFSTSILQNLNGESARRGKSKWAQLLNEKVTGNFSIIDDPTMDWGVGTTPFDDEGVPTKKKILLDNGKLKHLYYDGRSANLSKTKSTGNGFRSSYSAQPSIGVTNVTIKPKTISRSQEGMFIHDLMGFHNMNPISGDFSLDITLGELNGQSIRGCVLTGNLFEILEKGQWTGPTITRDWFTSPQLSFEGKVVAK